VADACLAEAKDLGIQAGDYDTLRAMLAYSARVAGKAQGIAQGLGVALPPIALNLDSTPGIPVEMRQTNRTDNILQLDRVDTGGLKDTTVFAIPPAYGKRPANAASMLIAP
jgi:hypothetical protein